MPRHPSVQDHTRDNGQTAERLETAERDQAVERDQAAEERDQAAAERDQAAAERDRRARARSSSDRAQAALDRDAAASDRAAAARDREEASRDREQAGLDDLTGALLRGRGLADLQREMDRARRLGEPLVVAFVDVDGLKAINDAHGHAAGDQLLRDVVAALTSGLRSYDLVIRYGGDEFLCVLPGTDIASARSRFEQVQRDLTEANEEAAVSVGVTELLSTEGIEELVARADAALYANPQRAR